MCYHVITNVKCLVSRAVLTRLGSWAPSGSWGPLLRRMGRAPLPLRLRVWGSVISGALAENGFGTFSAWKNTYDGNKLYGLNPCRGYRYYRPYLPLPGFGMYCVENSLLIWYSVPLWEFAPFCLWCHRKNYTITQGPWTQAHWIRGPCWLEFYIGWVCFVESYKINLLNIFSREIA